MGFGRIVNEGLVGPRDEEVWCAYREAPSDFVGVETMWGQAHVARDNDKGGNGCVRMGPCPKGSASPFILGVLP